MIDTNELRVFGNHVQKFRHWEKRTVTLKKQWKTSEITTLSEPTTEALVNQSSMATRRSTSIQKKSLFVGKRRLWQFDIWVRKAWCVRRGLNLNSLLVKRQSDNPSPEVFVNNNYSEQIFIVFLSVLSRIRVRMN